MTGVRVNLHEWLSPQNTADILHQRDKLYIGTRDEKQLLSVTINGQDPLPLRLDLYNHSPSGFETGYNGSGPAQLALALLADALGDDARALTLHHRFRYTHVANWTRESGFNITAQRVRDIADALEADLARQA